jgi:hypothetical protein
MKLRQALMDDFGIEVLLERGSGQRDDPFVIEPCSAAEATRTQLNLLRGLGRGRGELWRLLQAEAAPEVAPAVQRLRIETVLFTPEQIETETRAYYFDVSRVLGVPDAGVPLIEWNDSRATFSAVSQIGWLHFDGAIDNSNTLEVLDTTLMYSALGAKAAIYVYDPSDRYSEVDPSAELRDKELKTVSDQIRAIYSNAVAPWPVRITEPFALQYFLLGENLSVAGVALPGRHFLKFRLTYFDDPKMRELMEETILELARLTLMSARGVYSLRDATH